MVRLTTVFCCLIIIQAGIPLSAQPISFQRYDTYSGLSNNIIYDVYQDSNGFIWVATENGLNRFDGYGFETFHHMHGDTVSLTHSLVRSLVEDKQGNLWVGTFDGLNKFDPETREFTRFTQLPELGDKKLDIQTMRIDSAGYIWFSYPDGLLKLNPETNHITQISTRHYVYQFFIDNRNRIWTHFYDGENRFLGHLNDSVATNYRFVTHINRYPAYFGKYSGILWIKGKTEEPLPFSKIRALPELPDGILPTRVLEDTKGRLWIGSENGLYLYRPNLDTVHYLALDNARETLTENIRTIYEDRWGGIWVATLNGLYHHDPHQKPFLFMKPDSFKNKRFTVLSLLNTANQDMAAGTLGEGVFLFDNGDEFESIYRRIMPGEVVWDLHASSENENRVWIAANSGLYRYDFIKAETQRFDLPRRHIASPVVFDILSGDKSEIWVSGDENVYLLDENTGEVKKNIDFSEFENLSTIQSLHMYKDQFLFIGTEGLGLFVYHKKTGMLMTLSAFLETETAAIRGSVWAIFEDSRSRLWLGTGSGLYRLEVEGRSLIHIEEPLKTVSIFYSMLEDSNERLWMGTDRNLAMYDPEKKLFSYFDVRDGVENTEFNRRAALSSGQGELCFGGVDGITCFSPEKIRANPHPPLLHFTGFDLFKPDTLISKNIASGDDLHLSWNENTFEFHFTAINFTNAEQNTYRYRLKPFDPEWVDAGARRFARYVRVPFGAYTFEVQAANNDGVWNTAGISIAVSVDPPFWQAWWFRSMLIVVALGILWAIYRYRVGKIIEMERMRLRIAGDLHDEIGSGLSGIALTSEMIEQQAAAGGFPQTTLLKHIRENARELSSSLDSIVWLINPQRETIGDLVDKMQITSALILQGAKTEFESDIKEGLQNKTLPVFFRRNVFLLYKEAIHNIAKHAGADHIKITVTVDQHGLHLQIHDNGRGFDLKWPSNGFGLGNMHRRAVELGAELQISSHTGEGTKVYFESALP